MSKRAVIIVGKGFEDSEFIYPYYRLQEDNIEVDVATAGDGRLRKTWYLRRPDCKLFRSQRETIQHCFASWRTRGPR